MFKSKKIVNSKRNKGIVFVVVSLAVLLIGVSAFISFEKIGRNNYKIGCKLGVIETKLCQIMPKLVYVIEGGNNFENILPFQKEMIGYPSCDVGPRSLCEKEKPWIGYGYGFIDSELFVSPKDGYLKTLKNYEGKNYKYVSFSLNEKDKSGAIYFLDKTSGDLIKLAMIEEQNEWKIEMFLVRNIKNFPGRYWN